MAIAWWAHRGSVPSYAVARGRQRLEVTDGAAVSLTSSSAQWAAVSVETAGLLRGSVADVDAVGAAVGGAGVGFLLADGDTFVLSGSDLATFTAIGNAGASGYLEAVYFTAGGAL